VLGYARSEINVRGIRDNVPGIRDTYFYRIASIS
jgi:hypothetical protein